MKITYVIAEDWEGLYFDNTLVSENHSLQVGAVLQRLVGKVVEGVDVKWLDEDWLETQGYLPPKLEDVVVKGVW